MRVGWTPYWLANSLTVGAPLRAARATCALKLAVCCFRLPAIASPFLGHLSSLEALPKPRIWPLFPGFQEVLAEPLNRWSSFRGPLYFLPRAHSTNGYSV